MNESKVKKIIQYTLAISSQEDEYYEKDLGPIHFIKYVYLADMEYARFNNGETFTGVAWQFYHFGPWSNDVNMVIEPALNEIHAERKEIPSNYSDDDYIRWSLHNTDRHYWLRLEIELGLTVTSALKKHVHQFKNNTAALLLFVYATLPMLNAAPGEFLDFSVVANDRTTQYQMAGIKHTPYMQRLSSKRRKEVIAKMAELRETFQKKIKAQKQQYASHVKYDDVFNDGIRWLDSLSGEKLFDQETTISIDKSVWKSEARKGT